MKLIPITEALPEVDQDVIVWNGTKLAAAKYVRTNYVVSVDPNQTKKKEDFQFQVEKYPSHMDRSIITYWSAVTHWMPANITNPNENS